MQTSYVAGNDIFPDRIGVECKNIAKVLAIPTK